MKSLEQAYQDALNRLSRRQSVNAQVGALTKLLIEKRVFSHGEWQRAVIGEVELIGKVEGKHDAER